MKQRIHTDKFNQGETEHMDSYGAPDSSEKVDKFTNRSKMKSDGLKDHLMEAFKQLKPTLPKDNHKYSHTSQVKSRGAIYHPAGSFGTTARTGAGRGVYSYGGNVHSASPANAIGSPPNRHGQNAVGNAPERFGENALASKFRPSFSKPHGNRV